MFSGLDLQINVSAEDSGDWRAPEYSFFIVPNLHNEQAGRSWNNMQLKTISIVNSTMVYVDYVWLSATHL